MLCCKVFAKRIIGTFSNIPQLMLYYRNATFVIVTPIEVPLVDSWVFALVASAWRESRRAAVDLPAEDGSLLL